MKRILRSPTGHRIGQDHHRAKHSDADIELVRALHSEGLGYKRIAQKFEMPVSTVRNYCKGYRRDC